MSKEKEYLHIVSFISFVEHTIKDAFSRVPITGSNLMCEETILRDKMSVLEDCFRDIPLSFPHTVYKLYMDHNDALELCKRQEDDTFDKIIVVLNDGREYFINTLRVMALNSSNTDDSYLKVDQECNAVQWYEIEKAIDAKMKSIPVAIVAGKEPTKVCLDASNEIKQEYGIDVYFDPQYLHDESMIYLCPKDDSKRIGISYKQFKTVLKELSAIYYYEHYYFGERENKAMGCISSDEMKTYVNSEGTFTTDIKDKVDTKEEKKPSKLIVVINGKGASGKDTLINFINDTMDEISIMNVSSIDPVRESCDKIINACVGKKEGKIEKTDKYRKLLVDVKRAMVEYGDLPLRYLMEKTRTFFQTGFYNTLFIHIREPEEIKKYKNFVINSYDSSFNYAIRTLLVTRPETDKHDYGNDSDNNVKNFDYDYVYYNEKPMTIAKYDFCSFFAENFLTALYEKDELNTKLSKVSD